MKTLKHKRPVRPTGPSAAHRQSGVTLMEMMISLALSLVVTTAMITLMGNSMGSATRIIQMTQLSDELRNAMSMLSRDVRRANYNPYSLHCYANADCGINDDAPLKVNFINDLDVVFYDGDDKRCLRYFLERAAPTGEPGAVGGGGFRLARNDSVGHIEMWTGAAAPPADCSGDDWIAVTDPGFVNITDLTIEEDEGLTGTFSDTVLRKDGSVLLDIRARQVRIEMEGQLRIEPTITRRIEDTIRVRNDFIETPGP
jgi:type II secretory pathway pseudopilin PulG